MAAPKKSGTTRLLSFLRSGRTVTIHAASVAFNITEDSVRARISEFRRKGYPIYCNTRHFNGIPYKVYRLGAATRKVVAAGYKALHS